MVFDSPITSVSASPEGHLLALGFLDGVLRILDTFSVADGGESCTIVLAQRIVNNVNSIFALFLLFFCVSFA